MGCTTCSVSPYMWLHTWVLTNWNLYRAAGACCSINTILTRFNHFFLFLVAWTKTNWQRRKSPSACSWNPPRLVTDLTVATYLKPREPAPVPETCSIQVASESHDPGRRTCIPAVEALKHQNIHIIGAGGWKNVSDCCSRPQIVWQAVASPTFWKKVQIQMFRGQSCVPNHVSR